MGKGLIAQRYKTMSPEDKATFNRWLGANAVIGAMMAAGLVAMAWVGSNSVRSHDPVVAAGKKAPDLATPTPQRARF
jgi:hypothetical protein